MTVPGAVIDKLSDVAEWIQLVLAVLGVAAIAVGAFKCVAEVVRERKEPADKRGAAARLVLARYLMIALEFQLAADIIETSISPNWTKVARLAAIGAIRTGLNYFLSRDMKEDRSLAGETSAG